jgi:quercetin dioxygenase-like cupin family protein
MKSQLTFILTLAVATTMAADAQQPASTNAPGASAATNLPRARPRQAVADGGQKASQEANATPVLAKLLPDVPGKEVVMLTVTYPPGHAGAVHRHHADGFIYVLEGSVEMAVNGGAPVTLGPGQTFYEGPTDLHTIGRNASTTRPATFLVFLIKNKQAPITVPGK